MAPCFRLFGVYVLVSNSNGVNSNFGWINDMVGEAMFQTPTE